MEPSKLQADLVDGVLVANLVGVELFNRSPTLVYTVDGVRVEASSGSRAESSRALQARLVELHMPFSLAPSLTALLPVELLPGAGTAQLVRPALCSEHAPLRVNLVLSVRASALRAAFYEDEDERADEKRAEQWAFESRVLLELRCRRRRQSFQFTFVDYDGSLQLAAAIAPQRPAGGGRSAGVLVSLSGTSISAQNQADSHKHMPRGASDYVFGYERLWLLAPNRHGAHNWDAVGLRSVRSALAALARLVNSQPHLRMRLFAQLLLVSCTRTRVRTTEALFGARVHEEHVLLAGHSMGAHGAWHLATHYPDLVVGLVAQAGWIAKEQYGVDNAFFRYAHSCKYTLSYTHVIGLHR